MTELTPKKILETIDDGLDIASRWPRLLPELGFDPEQGRPGPLLLNNALQKLGFGRALDESDSAQALRDGPLPDAWWQHIAKSVTGDRQANVDQVIARLRQVNRVAAE